MFFPELKNFFQNPSQEYGPTPFLALNSELKPEELTKALKEISQAGMAGVFLHPRTGLEVPYLSEDFFDRIRIAIEICKELGLKAWLYDEYNWPSGVSAGTLLLDHPEYRQRYLDFLWVKKTNPKKRISISGKVLRVFSVGERIERVGDYFFDGKEIILPRIRDQALIFYEAENQDKSFVNSCANWLKPSPGYIDLMNPSAVQEFMNRTHYQYARRFSEHFGKTIPGIFTDEPQNYNGFPWSERFYVRFKEEYGYDPLERVYLLVLDREGYISYRVNYYGLCERMMNEGFYAPLSKFCEEHNLILTGHLGMEERISQMPVNHGGIYSHLSFFQMPGIDALNVGEGIEGGLGNMEAPNFSVKMVSSIAHLQGKNRVLCETGGGAGWGMTLGEFKRMVDWLFALGINFINPHLILLSLKGLRKRDFPPSHFWQEPWFEFYPDFSRYVARVSWLLSQGEHQPEIAILIPSSAIKVLSRGRGYKEEELEQVSRQIEDLSRFLLQNQLDFEYIFEEAILEGKVRVEEGRLIAGKESFPVLLAPGVRVLEQSALKLIGQFLEQKGKVIFLGALPDYDQRGEETGEWKRALFKYKEQVKIFSEAESASGMVIEALARLGIARLSFYPFSEGNIIYHSRRVGEDEVYFLANLSEHWLKPWVWLRSNKKGLVQVLPWEGKIKGVAFERKGEELCFQLELAPYQSLVLVAGDEIFSSWLKSADLFITELDEDKISGFSNQSEIKIKISGKELKFSEKRTLPPPIILNGAFGFKPFSANVFRLGPFRMRAKSPPARELSQLKDEPHFSRQTKALIYIFRPLIRLLNFILGPEKKYPGLIYEGFGELEGDIEKFSKVMGIELNRFGLYQLIELLFRFSDYFPLITWFRTYPPPGELYQAEASFHLKYVPESLKLVFENLAEEVKIRVNGKRVEVAPEKLLVWDSSNLAVEIMPYLRKGKNRILFESRQLSYPCLYPCFHSLEPMVLLGEFEVDKKRIIQKREEKKPLGDLSQLGYSDYSGKVSYQTEFELKEEYLDYELILECPAVRAQLEVWVNDKFAGRSIGPVYRFFLNDLVQAGINRLELRVSNTSANLLANREVFGLLGPVAIFPFYRFRKTKSELEEGVEN